MRMMMRMRMRTVSYNLFLCRVGKPLICPAGPSVFDLMMFSFNLFLLFISWFWCSRRSSVVVDMCWIILRSWLKTLGEFFFGSYLSSNLPVDCCLDWKAFPVGAQAFWPVHQSCRHKMAAGWNLASELTSLMQPITAHVFSQLSSEPVPDTRLLKLVL